MAANDETSCRKKVSKAGCYSGRSRGRKIRLAKENGRGGGGRGEGPSTTSLSHALTSDESSSAFHYLATLSNLAPKPTPVQTPISPISEVPTTQNDDNEGNDPVPASDNAAPGLMSRRRLLLAFGAVGAVVAGLWYGRGVKQIEERRKMVLAFIGSCLDQQATTLKQNMTNVISRLRPIMIQGNRD